MPYPLQVTRSYRFAIYQLGLHLWKPDEQQRWQESEFKNNRLVFCDIGPNHYEIQEDDLRIHARASANLAAAFCLAVLVLTRFNPSTRTSATVC